MTGNLLGESFDRYVREQIETRQQVYGSGYSSLRTPEQINYLNNRNAWIKMASSVTIEDRNVSNTTGEDAGLDDLIDGEFTNVGRKRLNKLGFSNPSDFLGTKLAEQSVLFNGLSSVTPSTFQKNDKGEITDRTYGSYEFRSGVIDKKDTIWNQNFAYGLGGTDYGIQPMPGIIDFSVEAVNRGSIRKGTVTIKAFNKFQFELIELLYIRLGYTMLVEWGWDRYITKDKNDNTVVESVGNTIIEDLWFNQNDYTQIKMLQAIERYRGYYDGNYDAFFGKVSNFDWSFNPDGSYNITLNLITVGDVIESLKIKNKVLPIDTSNNEDQESALISTVNNNVISQHLYLTTEGSNKEKYFNLTNPYYKSLKPLQNTELYKTNTPLNKIPEKYSYYISFYKLLYFIKDKIIPNIENKSSKRDKQLDIDLSSKSICNSYINHISLDPRICFIKPKFYNEESFKASNAVFKRYLDFTYEKEICEGSPKKSYTYGNVMNIYLNYEFIAENLKNTINDKEANIYEFLNNICQGINKALGGVTNLEPVIKDDYIITIIEQNPLPIDLIEALGGNVDNKPVPLEVYGYSNDTSNFVKNISFKTKITPQLSSQISIAATSEGIGTQNYEATAFSKWNDGLADRFTYKYSQTSTSKEDPEVSEDLWEPADTKLEEIFKTAKALQGGKVSVRGYEVKNYKWPNGTTTDITFKEKTFENFKEAFLRTSTRIRSSKQTEELQQKQEYENTWDGYLKNAFVDFKYFEFNEDFINKGKDIFEVTYKNLINDSYRKNGEVINTIGFIPVTFDLTLDGLSGIKIYQKLEIQQDFLPYQYPQAFDFLITKVNHKISNNGWDTQLNTISTSNLKNLPAEPLRVIGNLESDVILGPFPENNPIDEFTGPTPNADRLREVLNTLGYQEKNKEISNGGDITPQAADMGIAVFTKIKELYPNLSIIVTGGNDLYHQQYNSPSRHKIGNGLDFTVIPNLPQNITNVENILKGFSVGNNPNFRYINEYANPTKNASGKHFHISWGAGTEGQTTLQLALAEAQQNQIPSYLV